MTDRELLEAAAKAAGYSDAKWQDMEGWGEVRYGFSSAIWSDKIFEEGGSGYWNPLTDDGDALRLAVKLRMFLDLEYLCAQAKSHAWFGGGDDPSAGMAHDECDPYAATRRAIVRAAAAMGEKA